MVSLSASDDFEGEPTPLHLQDLAQSELVEMVKELQLETSGLRAELRALSGTRLVTAKAEEPADPVGEHRTKFLELGKKFCILSELWADGTALGRAYPTTIQDTGPWSHDRYENAASMKDGVTAEIYACVPQEFHKLVHISPLFSSTFLEGMGDMRGYMIDIVRKNGPAIFGITGLSGIEFRTSYDRSTVPEFVELLKSPHAPGETFAAYPRLFYEDHDTTKLLFGSQVIVNVLRAILLGPTSVGKTGRARRSGPRPLASRLELTSITPGAIAAAATIARFILSPDTAFTEEGSTTPPIKYREDFDRYKAFLVKYGQTDAIKTLIGRLNADILQIYEDDTQARTPSAIPQAGEEDLVAQALLNMQGAGDISVPPIGPAETVQPDHRSPVPSISNPSSSRLRATPHISSPVVPTSPPDHPSPQLATDSEEDVDIPDPEVAPPQQRRGARSKGKAKPAAKKTTRNTTKPS